MGKVVVGKGEGEGGFDGADWGRREKDEKEKGEGVGDLTREGITG